jgi:hypothetical protein
LVYYAEGFNAENKGFLKLEMMVISWLEMDFLFANLAWGLLRPDEGLRDEWEVAKCKISHLDSGEVLFSTESLMIHPSLLGLSWKSIILKGITLPIYCRVLWQTGKQIPERHFWGVSVKGSLLGFWCPFHKCEGGRFQLHSS